MLKLINSALHQVGLDMNVQNLNHRPGDGLRKRWGEATGNIWREGRLWVRANSDSYDTKLRFSWHVGLNMPGFSITIDDCEHEILFRVEGPVGTLWLSIPLGYSDLAKEFLAGVQRLAGVHKYSNVDVISVTFHHGGFWWRFMQDPDEWCATDPWWKRSNVDFENLLLGESKVKDELLGPVHNVEIPMPEGTYRWKIQMKRCTVTRRFTKDVFVRFAADCHKGQHIPFPGKGESSWDCGPDGSRGLYASADTVEEAIGKIVASVLRTRKKRGARPNYSTDGVYDA